MHINQLEQGVGSLYVDFCDPIALLHTTVVTLICVSGLLWGAMWGFHQYIQ